MNIKDIWTNKLVEMNACAPALDWFRDTQPSLADAWANCKDGSWMLWLLARCDPTSQLSVKYSPAKETEK